MPDDKTKIPESPEAGGGAAVKWANVADWFEARGLQPPDTYSAMAAAAEGIYDREALISGLVVPTESNLVTTHQAFEQIALANGCQLIDKAGEVTILDEVCREALNHYFTTIM